MNNVFDYQVGGDHYKKLQIQPTLFIHANGFGFVVGNIIKYACRYAVLGNTQDLKKIIHYAQIAEKNHKATYDLRSEKKMLEPSQQSNPVGGGRQERDMPVCDLRPEKAVEGDASGASSGRKDERSPV